MSNYNLRKKRRGVVGVVLNSLFKTAERVERFKIVLNK